MKDGISSCFLEEIFQADGVGSASSEDGVGFPSSEDGV